MSAEDQSNSLPYFLTSSENQPNTEKTVLDKDPYLNLKNPIRVRKVGHHCYCREYKNPGCYDK